MNEEILAKKAMLDLLVELKRICDKNEINYFLIGGTLLGAIRHNGYIPWDDDIDVGMLRSDYDKFLKICEKELNPLFSLENYIKDKYNPNVYCKIKINNTVYIEESVKHNKGHKEIFIDVFPFENTLNDKKTISKQNRRIQLLRRMIAIKCKIKYSTKKIGKQIVYFFIKMVSLFFSKRYLINKLLKIETQFNKYNVDYAVNCNGAYSYETELFPKQILNNTILHKFEGIEFKIPKDYDYVLSQMYGDYMKLPSKQDRKGKHKIISFDLGTYRPKSKIITIKEER